MSVTMDVVRLALKDMGDTYATTGTGDDVLVRLDLDLVGSSPASGGNTAGAILDQLRWAGLDVTATNGSRAEWWHLLEGREVRVSALAEMPTPELALRRYGQSWGTQEQRTNRLVSAGRWAKRHGLKPVDGRSPALWPREETMAALAAEGGSGNRSRRT